MEKHCFGSGLRHSLHGKQLFNRRLPNGADRLEGAQQRPCARFADAFNLGQRADQRVFCAFAYDSRWQSGAPLPEWRRQA